MLSVKRFRYAGSSLPSITPNTQHDNNDNYNAREKKKKTQTISRRVQLRRITTDALFFARIRNDDDHDDDHDHDDHDDDRCTLSDTSFACELSRYLRPIERREQQYNKVVRLDAVPPPPPTTTTTRTPPTGPLGPRDGAIP